ncbi:MAG: hypothetical protein K2N06_09700 [Oscillospiraceae bacterium]|nr:hypothetical protein [Oscillospiraceae bacterium]
MDNTASTVIMIIVGAAIFAYGVLLMIFAITGKGFAKMLDSAHRARLGCSAVMTMLIGLWLVALNFTE